MSEKRTPIITEVGEIKGRDAIFLDRVQVINEQTFELTGEFNSNLCSKIKDEEKGKFKKYKITFKNVLSFKMIELDFYENEKSNSSFDLIENSEQVAKMLTMDHSNKIKDSFQHFVFSTYDTIFEIVGMEFELNIY